MARRNREMSSGEFERAMDRSNRRSARRYGGYGSESDDDIFESLWVMLFVGAIVLGLLAAGVGWLDHQFGWGILPWFQGVVHDLLHRK